MTTTSVAPLVTRILGRKSHTAAHGAHLFHNRIQQDGAEHRDALLVPPVVLKVRL